MAWIPIASAVAGSVASGLLNNSGKGGSGSSVPSYPAQMMPDWMRNKFESGIGGMPGTTNINFGGMTYPSIYGPALRAAKTLYSPAGANVTGPSTSPLTGGLSAAAPWMWMAANNQQMTGPEGWFSSNIPYNYDFGAQFPAPQYGIYD
jgi:hypothetical protein